MEPIYTPCNTSAAYQLNWGLTLFWSGVPIGDAEWLGEIQTASEPDGVRILKHRSLAGGASQFFVSSKPDGKPCDLIRSVKGRLQHVIRSRSPKAFQRNYCLRSIGAARRDVVENYVADQLGHHRMADPRVQDMLARFQRDYASDLSKPSFTAHGEFWHNLHLVLVNNSRVTQIREDVLERISDMIERAAAKHGDRLSRVALLADHLHLTMGCAIDRSAEEVALCYLNNCAFACGMKPVFQYGYFAGTFGEYDLGVV